MKKKIMLAAGALAIAVSASFYLTGADHIEAPLVGSLSTGSTILDITDFYAFESPENSDNYVFVCNVMGLLGSGAQTQNASFDPDVMYEFNIDTNGDNVEDLVIQSIFRDDVAIVYGPVAPTATGRNSVIETSGNRVEVELSSTTEVNVAESGGVRVFAGPRDDPFFMDFLQFVDIVNGAGAFFELDVPDPEDDDDADGTPEYDTSFDSPGSDTFAGSNVLSLVVELPKDMIGGAAVTTFSSWAESKSRQ
ncbi:MAG: DUF4331 family protein [Bacteroidota bacterium]